jgi:FAD/FMN-containing dehydrogenase
MEYRRGDGAASMNGYAARRDAIAASMRGAGGGTFGLAKETSNLFRDRARGTIHWIDARAFDHVLAVDPAQGLVEAEGMATYAAIVDATLAQGTMPAVVPQLVTITLGGAAAGVGVEATSFRHGLVHETLQEFDVLTGNDKVVTCTRNNEHADLFFGFPNSYGTLGYALRLVARTQPVKPFVGVAHRSFTAAADFFDALNAACCGDADFLDGAVFGPRAMVISEGRFVDAAPYTSDYRYEHMYYRSLQERATDFLTTRDFLWRWDTDWFWCSKNVGAQNPLLRRLLGRGRLNSRTYQKIMRWNVRVGATRRFYALRGGHHEAVIQDVDIPIHRAASFLSFLLSELRILPIWICPVRPSVDALRFALYPMVPRETYVNFGFWDTVHRPERHEPGHFNRRVEDAVARHDGIKSLYSDSYYEREQFDRLYGGAAYRGLKARYDPDGRFPDLFDKVVRRS